MRGLISATTCFGEVKMEGSTLSLIWVYVVISRDKQARRCVELGGVGFKELKSMSGQTRWKKFTRRERFEIIKEKKEGAGGE
jgi:hypothetical protein